MAKYTSQTAISEVNGDGTIPLSCFKAALTNNGEQTAVLDTLLNIGPGDSYVIGGENPEIRHSQVHTVTFTGVGTKLLTVVKTFLSPCLLWLLVVGMPVAAQVIKPTISPWFLELSLRGKRTPPAGIALPFSVIGINKQGRVVIDKTGVQILKSYASLTDGTTTCFVDAVSGSDANAGTALAPYATMGQAHSTSNNVIRFAAGNYAPFDHRRNVTTGTAKGNIVRYFYGSGDALNWSKPLSTKTVIRFAGDLASGLMWSISGLGNNTVQATLTTTNIVCRVLSGRFRDEYGLPIPLTKQTTAAAANTSGGWFYDSGTKVLTVRFGTLPGADNTARLAHFTASILPELELVYRGTSNNLIRFDGAEVYVENVVFYGVQPWCLQVTGTRSRPVFKNCAFLYGETGGITNDGGETYTLDCFVYRPGGDGVGGHVNGGVEAKVIDVNGHYAYAGDIDTFAIGTSNKNALSTHENGMAAYLGSVARKSNGPNIIDTGTGTGSTGKSWWYSVTAEQSLGATVVNQNFVVYGTRIVFMDSCAGGADSATEGVKVGEASSTDNPTTLYRYGNNVAAFATYSTAAVIPYVPKF